MKKHTINIFPLILPLLLLLTGCVTRHGSILREKDEFTGKTLIYMELQNQTSDPASAMFAKRFVSMMRFSREYINDQKKEMQLELKIMADNTSDRLTNNIYFKPDNAIIKKRIIANTIESKAREYHTTETKTKTTLTEKSKSSSDSSSSSKSSTFSSSKPKVETETEVSHSRYTRHWKELTATVLFSNDLEQQILQCKTLAIRLYSGNMPVTFLITSRDLESLKKFILTTDKSKIKTPHNNQSMKKRQY